MQLRRFRVTNFKSVLDSDWIEIDRVGALIGVNESGKTNLLLPLWKLNPAAEGEIKPTSDYPKAYFADVKANPSAFAFISAEFDAPELAPRLASMSKLSKDQVSRFRVTKYFDDRVELDFPDHDHQTTAQIKEIDRTLILAKEDLEKIPGLAKESALKPSLIKAIEDAVSGGNSENVYEDEQINNIVTHLTEAKPDVIAPTSSIIPRYLQLIEQLEAVAQRLAAPLASRESSLVQLVLSLIPRFVYYSNYGNLDSEIYLPHVVDNLKREDLGARELAKARTLRVLFSFVRLSPGDIMELGRDFPRHPSRNPTESEIAEVATKKRERTILLNSAGTILTKKFREWWKQGDYTFEFQADGDHFRIWVSDSRRPEKVELEDRSAGLQWFLSFYLTFLVESGEDHRDAVLLLDEPGLSLHPLAQRDLSAFFENLGKTNQLLYTTHSPFLVDADMLDRARKVFVSDDGSTRASADLRRGSDDPRQAGATYAIYSALNMNVAESMLFGCAPIIVEGPSDQHYLSTIKIMLGSLNKIAPRREVVFPPCHGAKNAKTVASILSGRSETLPPVLLDGDEVGRKTSQDLKNGLYKAEKEKIFITDEFVGFEGSEVEDLMPPLFVADVVGRWLRGRETDFSEILVCGKPIVPQLEAWALSQGITLNDGWKVDLARLVKTRLLARGVESVDAEYVKKWETMFGKLVL